MMHFIIQRLSSASFKEIEFDSESKTSTKSIFSVEKQA